MKKSQYWSVKLSHAKAAYNDENEFAIINGNGYIIAKFFNGDREKLAEIVDAHNRCFFDDVQAGEEKHE